MTNADAVQPAKIPSVAYNKGTSLEGLSQKLIVFVKELFGHNFPL
jgi:hypothetical protein